MKRILSLVAVALSTLAVSAQMVTAPKGLLQKNPAYLPAASTILKAPARANLKDGQFLIGHYVSDAYEKNGLGLGQNVTIQIGTDIAPVMYAGLKNCKIEGLRFALATPAPIKGVYVHAYDVDGNVDPTPLAKKTFSENCPLGWNQYEFDEPVAIPEGLGGLVAAYEISLSASEYPIGVYAGSETASLLGYGRFSSSTTKNIWADFGTDYGTAAIQLICSSDAPEGFSVNVASVATPAAGVNSTTDVVVKFNSVSAESFTELEYVVNFNGKQETRTVQLPAAVPAGLNQKGSFTFSLATPANAGIYDGTITITKVNGVSIESLPANFNVTVLTRIVRRFSVVEELTGTGCPWCTRGWAGMELLKKLRPHFLGIGIHMYNNSDPMYITAYNLPDELQGAPSCIIDRVSGAVDPYYGTERYSNGILGDFDEYNAIFPTVDVKVKALYTDDTRSTIDVEADVEYLADANKNTVVFVLTADGLTGTAGWFQGNNYASYSTAQAGILDDDKEGLLTQFCKGQTNGKSSVGGLVFDDVLIGSSFEIVNKQYLNNNATDLPDSAPAGMLASSTARLSIPTTTDSSNKNASPLIMDAIQRDKVYVTALVYDENMHIANAARCRVVTAEEYAAGINGVVADDASSVVYDLSGRVAHKASKGIFIRNGKKVIF